MKNKTSNVRINVTLRRVLATIVAVEKHYILCVSVYLVNQHAMRMRHISSLTCPALQYSSTLSHKRHDFRKKKSYWT